MDYHSAMKRNEVQPHEKSQTQRDNDGVIPPGAGGGRDWGVII